MFLCFCVLAFLRACVVYMSRSRYMRLKKIPSNIKDAVRDYYQVTFSAFSAFSGVPVCCLHVFGLVLDVSVTYVPFYKAGGEEL